MLGIRTLREQSHNHTISQSRNFQPVTMPIPFLDNLAITTALPYPRLIKALQQGFQEEYTVPMRHHHSYENPAAGMDSTLLLMPAWKSSEYVGIKIITVSPNNGEKQLPSVQGVYLLFDAITGAPLAQLDAKTLTNRRTAAASALASSFLSRKDSTSLLMVGTGNMAPALIEAHAAVRPIQKVYIWGRNLRKAQALAAQFKDAPFSAEAILLLAPIVPKVDIISCATLSKHALIKGEWLQAGQHVDLVGSFTPNMREADDEAIRRANVYVDVLEGATKESGDILIPLNNGTLERAAIKGDLFDLCRNQVAGRQAADSITLFKSVGHALEDLVAAKLVYQSREVRS